MSVQKTFVNVDWILILLYLILVFLGWVNVVSATMENMDSFYFSMEFIYVKQLVWVVMSIFIIAFLFNVQAKYYERFAGLIYAFSLVSLAGLFVVGKTVAGQTCWYQFGGFSIQPSEFAKIATSLAIAKYTSEINVDISKLKHQFTVILLIILPVVLIVMQPDPGSMLVYSALFLVLFREGLPPIYIWVGFLAILFFYLTLVFGDHYVALGLFAVLSAVLLYNFRQKRSKINVPLVLIIFATIVGYVYSISFVFNEVFKPHHRDRFNILLGRQVDLKGTGYNTNQSEIAIGSGGWTGKGYLEGTQTRGDFVPEQHTDYIFTIVGEEWGFLGASIVILLFAGLILRLLYLAEKQKSKFARVYGYCVASIFFVHFLINVGMVLGVMPTVGIPLPFFSYGGSSLWSFTILLFIFIKLEANNLNEW
ncbi:MAG: rod shape-determining protein RodA [Flavobacteriales bacterium]|nr:rod shape-determining protein RodA [Flavobacteriales bacterium]